MESFDGISAMSIEPLLDRMLCKIFYRKSFFNRVFFKSAKYTAEL
jgi:hypothetical protein